MTDSRIATTLLLLVLAVSPTGLGASESCSLLVEEVKELCTRTLENEPIWMSCAYYYRVAFEVLGKGGDETWTLDDHCSSLEATMQRVRENRKDRKESAEAIPASSDPQCTAQREELLERCLGLFDGDELPPELEVGKCAGRFGLFERGLLEHCG